ncbi:MAG: hypothetical protein R3B47_12055 [Bacteroidia bacterium]
MKVEKPGDRRHLPPSPKQTKSKNGNAPLFRLSSAQRPKLNHNSLSEPTKRWAVEIDIRDAFAYYGLGKSHLGNPKSLKHSTNCIIWAACRTVWFYQHLGQEPPNLQLVQTLVQKK